MPAHGADLDVPGSAYQRVVDRTALLAKLRDHETKLAKALEVVRETHAKTQCRSFSAGSVRGVQAASGRRNWHRLSARRHGEHRGTARRSLKEWRGRGPERPRRHLFQATFRLQSVAEPGFLAREHGAGPTVMERGCPGLPGQPPRVPLCALRRAHLASVRLLRRRLVLPETVPLVAQPGLCTGGAFRPHPCSSPQIHCSVKPLCSPRLRGEFSRRRCSAGRPPVSIATRTRSK
jgi:hypothetical protein